MLALRLLLGIGEAAFVGVPFYLSFFYKRDELAFRTGLFISAAPLATSFAGSLAWIITKFGDRIPIASWRILFLLEGFPSVVVAIFVWLFIPDGPESVRYLTHRQRNVASSRLRSEKGHSNVTHKKGLKQGWTDIRRTLADPQAYLTALMFFCCNVAFSSLPVFLPTIITEMGYSQLASQGLSAPPYLVAFLTVLVTAWVSDRYKKRSLFVIFHAILAALGYAMMAITGYRQASPLVRYIGVFPAAMGFFSAITIIITWTLNNQDTDFGKGAGLSVLNYVGQLGPLVGVHLYPSEDAPYYTKGLALCAGFMVIVAILALLVRMILTRRNKNTRAGRIANGKKSEGHVNVQGVSRNFFYII